MSVVIPTGKEILEYLKDNLSISVFVDRQTVYGPSEEISVKVELLLNNKVISEDESSVTID
jgi:hypothetical protein